MYLGIDIGTSSVKTVLFDADQRLLGQASAALGVSRPHPGWSEQDPEAWWAATLQTIDAVADHGDITGDTVSGTADEAQQVFDGLAAVGVDLPDVFKVLEDEGVDKFEKAWNELLEATQGQLDEKK